MCQYLIQFGESYRLGRVSEAPTPESLLSLSLVDSVSASETRSLSPSLGVVWLSVTEFPSKSKVIWLDDWSPTVSLLLLSTCASPSPPGNTFLDQWSTICCSPLTCNKMSSRWGNRSSFSRSMRSPVLAYRCEPGTLSYTLMRLPLEQHWVIVLDSLLLEMSGESRCMLPACQLIEAPLVGDRLSMDSALGKVPGLWSLGMWTTRSS